MKRDVFYDFEDERLSVFDSSNGKLIVYVSSHAPRLGDCLTATMPWESIEILEERAEEKFFTWMMHNGAFAVQGKNDRWILAFRMNRPPYRLVPVFLSPSETEAVKDYLFKARVTGDDVGVMSYEV